MLGKPYNDEELGRIKSLHLQGFNLHEIAEQLKRSDSSVFNRAKAMGLDTRCNHNHSIAGKKAWQTKIKKYGSNGCSKEGLQRRVVAIRKFMFSERNPIHRADVRRKISLAERGIPCPQRDPNPEKRIKATMEALHKHPNVPEGRLNTLLQLLFPNEYKYVGDGSFIIAGKCPDFVNVNGKKKIIELFGVAFHNPNHAFFEVPYERTQQGRIELFREYGFDTLIVWDFELDNIPLLSDRLVEFHNGVQV